MTPSKRPGTAVAKRPAQKAAGLPAGLAVGQPFTSDVVVKLMEDPELLAPEIIGLFEFHGGDPEATAESIAAQDFGATSLEELFGGGESVGSKDFVDQIFCLKSVSYNKTDMEGGAGLPFYAVLHGVTPDGEPVHVTSGAQNIVRKAALADSKGWLNPGPVWVVIRATETKRGRTALSLEAAPKAEELFS